MIASPQELESIRRAALVASLRLCRMFATLSSENLEAVAEGCSLRNLAREETLFREGDRVEGFYILRSGSISVYRVTPDGREQIICVFRPPESFAEATLATFETYPANAVALEASQVIVVHRSAFRELIRRNPDLSLHMLGSMSQHLKHLVQVIQDLKGRQVDTRLAEWILNQSPAAQVGCPAVLDLPISKRVLAGQIGATSETLSRLFARLSKKDILKVKGRRLTILDSKALKTIARGV
ncbi:MAG: Crp/Fnr family transcriptional regulator [Opitutaceae bacterium]|nr:Crp/Fnr family transcriptional regulator [Opitutaceae bacterium]